MRYSSDSGKTWIDDEEKAYNTPTGTHLGSGRRAKAICEDGKIRTITIGIPDTFFSIPGHCLIQGKTVVGYVTTMENGDFEFRANKFNRGQK